MSKQLFENGIEKTGTGYIFFENIIIIGTLLLGFVGMLPVQVFNLPLLSIFYVVFIAIMLVFTLRKHLCTQCYYYGKACHCGWGKLSSKLYKIESGNQKLGGKLAIITWSTLMLLPLIVMIILLIKNFTFFQLYVFIAFVVLVIINNVLHIKDCKECKMRYICPGSAARK